MLVVLVCCLLAASQGRHPRHYGLVVLSLSRLVCVCVCVCVCACVYVCVCVCVCLLEPWGVGGVSPHIKQNHTSVCLVCGVEVCVCVCCVSVCVLARTLGGWGGFPPISNKIIHRCVWCVVWRFVCVFARTPPYQTKPYLVCCIVCGVCVCVFVCSNPPNHTKQNHTSGVVWCVVWLCVCLLCVPVCVCVFARNPPIRNKTTPCTGSTPMANIERLCGRPSCREWARGHCASCKTIAHCSRSCQLADAAWHQPARV